MADAALFLGWNRPVVGREVVAMEGFGAAIGYLTKQQQAGQIESFEPVLLMPHGGDLNGFILVRGDLAKLGAMQQTEEYKEIVSRAAWYLQGFGAVPAMVNATLQEGLTRYQKIIAS